jgi:serine/threonine protein kinase
MGKVFRAEHQLMGRQVAIKVMSPALLSDAESCFRFRQEVRLVAQLCHPNIVLALDADEEEGLHFFVMEYVSGADLGQIVGEYGPLPIPFACECVRQTALGLQHAHEHGLVHCDIKPSNLLLRDGMTSVYKFLSRPTGGDRPLIKILDFGLARLAGHGTDSASGRGSPEPALCGTPDFMAPELGRDSTTVDIRCDLYSLGCTFSFLLTGQVPYPGGSWSEKLIRHHYDPAIPVCQMRPDVPAAVAQIVARLMAKDPLDRFSTPGEVAVAIAAWQETASINSRASLPSIPATFGPRTVVPTSSNMLLWVNDGCESEPNSMSATNQRVHASSRRSTRMLWPFAAAMAIAIGLGSAWLLCSPRLRHSVQNFEPWTKVAPIDKHFHVAGANESYGRLEQAISHARDGDTILVRGNGPFVFRGVSLRGKSLTIKADADSRPQFELIPLNKEDAWEPLFVANKSLTLEGLQLHYGGERAASAGPTVAHLVYVEGAPLKLVDCTLTGSNAQALVVTRRSPRIELDRCTISADSAAICVELCERGLTTLQVSHSQLAVHDAGAATAVLWASGPVQDGCQLELEENELEGSRLIALNCLGGLTTIRATKNSFRFHESLLSVLSKNALQLSQMVHWQGVKNHFAPGSKWVTWNSEGLPIKNLEQWRKCWNSTETGSLEETTAALPVTSTRND